MKNTLLKVVKPKFKKKEEGKKEYEIKVESRFSRDNK